MKSLLLVGLLLLLPAGGIGSNRSSAGTPLSVPCWPEDTVINVYFVRDLFSFVEKQSLQDAMTSWVRKPENRNAGISFLFAGETGGLIDCVNCLTIARRGLVTDRPKQRLSVNALRQDNAGQLVSAWIAFERAIATPAGLRSQMLEVLERGFPIGGRAGKIAAR